jgi:hypothetical protein
MYRIVLTAVFVIVVAGCATQEPGPPAPAPQKKQDAAAAEADAQTALNNMDNIFAGKSTGSSTVSTAPAQQPAQTPPPAQSVPVVTSATQPGWTEDPYILYNKNQYVAVVGHGSDRNSAERDALVKLTAFFGQSIQSELQSISGYYETMKNGAKSVSSNDSVQEIIKTSTNLDSLLGAEIKNIWSDTAKTLYYALAVMEKETAGTLYSALILSNLRLIDTLLSIPESEKDSLDAYSRYRIAALLADTNKIYGDVLSIVGNKDTDLNSVDMKTGNDYRLEATNIIKTIPIAISVTGDKADRVKAAFATSLNQQGFRSGGTNSRYVLKVDVALSEVALQPPNKFARIEINARLTDTADDAILLPWNFNGREGHVNLAEAENRAISFAEDKIKGEYGTVLQNYLSTLLPD